MTDLYSKIGIMQVDFFATATYAYGGHIQIYISWAYSNMCKHTYDAHGCLRCCWWLNVCCCRSWFLDGGMGQSCMAVAYPVCSRKAFARVGCFECGIHVCAYVCMAEWGTHVHKYIHVCVCVCVWVYIYSNVYVCVYIYMYICVCTCLCICMCVCAFYFLCDILCDSEILSPLVYIHIYMYIYIYIYIYMVL